MDGPGKAACRIGPGSCGTDLEITNLTLVSNVFKLQSVSICVYWPVLGIFDLVLFTDNPFMNVKSKESSTDSTL